MYTRCASYCILTHSDRMTGEVIHMRSTCAEVIKTYFRRKLVAVRTDLNKTQEEMAQDLSMSLRSYNDLENGKFCCSATTLILFLIKVCPDPMQFIDELRKVIERELESE